MVVCNVSLKFFRAVGSLGSRSSGNIRIQPSSTSLRRRFCQSPPGKRLPELTLYTKTPCPLCDDALEALSPALHRVTLRKVDITLPENRRWYKLYRYDIPVFHLNGAFLMKHRGDMKVLLEALEAWEGAESR
ncbi:glutaredoxin-like protein C5orf63 homolog [Amphibalanus amphitrite]|uniref:glutaredoxin-like protein C5orf63 homolog n=1 Tax=Amphibalanus amphitrite TaxID=1232801 RepID=UPI001C90B23A|nr:glutaredoxin-like protein C5orf63 homolog [Amphibalanus amphitrite]